MAGDETGCETRLVRWVTVHRRLCHACLLRTTAPYGTWLVTAVATVNLAGPALIGSAWAQTPAAAPATAYSVATTTIADLLDKPALRAIFEKHLLYTLVSETDRDMSVVLRDLRTRARLSVKFEALSEFSRIVRDMEVDQPC